MNELVERLSKGDHHVEVVLARPDGKLTELEESVKRGYVHIKFTDTRGGTELGVRLDNEATDLSQANFHDGTGTATFIGRLELNYVPVKLIASIDLTKFSGVGHLEIVQP